MGEGQSNTTTANVKNIKKFIIYDVKAGLHVSTLLSHIHAVMV